MKKINSLVLSTLTAALLVGCGGGSSSTTSTTSVPVTKGFLIKAEAVDANGKVGTQVMDGNKYTNEYKFDGEVAYPITVTKGVIDKKPYGVYEPNIDYPFTGKLTSYSNVVTPITTYLGNPDEPTNNYVEKLEKLKELSGASEDELTSLDPSKTNLEIMSLNTAIYRTYEKLMDNDTGNDSEDVDDISSDDSALSVKLKETIDKIPDDIKESGDLDSIFEEVEDNLIEELVTDTGLSPLSDLDVAKLDFSKDDLVGNKLVVGSETYYFRENDVVLGDSGEDYTEILSYGSIEDGIIKLEFDDGNYDLLELTESGFDVSYYEDGSLTETLSITSELTEYTEAELTEVLADVEFIITEDMISGKEIYISDEIGEVNAQFKSDGTYSEVFDDTISGGESGTCSGEWELSDNVISVTSTCSDSDTQETFTLSFDEVPTSGTIVTVTDSEGTEEVTLTTVSDISEENSSSEFTLTESMISGKEIVVTDEDGTMTAQFKSDGTYSEVWDDTASGGDSGDCTGTWELNSSVSNRVDIEGTCSDMNGVSESFYLIFNETPTAGSEIEYYGISYDESGTVTLTSISDIEIKLISPSYYQILTENAYGKKLLVFDRYVKFNGFGSFKSYSESESNIGDDVQCNGFWEYDEEPEPNNRYKITVNSCSQIDSTNGNTIDTNTSYTTYVQFNDDIVSNTEIILEESSNTNIPVLFAAKMNESAVYNKSIELYNENTDETFTHNFTDYSNYNNGGNYATIKQGVWRDLGENKIGFTVSDLINTNKFPDGILDEYESHLQFNSQTPVVGDSVTLTTIDGIQNLVIKSISSIK